MLIEVVETVEEVGIGAVEQEDVLGEVGDVGCSADVVDAEESRWLARMGDDVDVYVELNREVVEPQHDILLPVVFAKVLRVDTIEHQEGQGLPRHA